MTTALGLLFYGISTLTPSVAAPCTIERAAVAQGVIWLLCDREQVMVSRDEGITWSRSKLPDDTKMRTIHAFDVNRAMVAGDSGMLLQTSDAGQSWTKVEAPTQENLTSIFFLGENGWISGWGGAVLHSSDGGRVWKRQETNLGQSLESVFFSDERHGWAVGWAGAMIRTSDGGQTWQKVRSSVLSSLNSVYFRDDRNGWVVGFDGQILRTQDGGEKWEAETAPIRESLESILFDERGGGWIAANTHLLYSGDGGRTWSASDVPGVLAVSCVIPMGEDILAVGQTGLLRRKSPLKETSPKRVASES